MSILKVLWVKPTPGLIKLNVDGAAKGNPGLAGEGGVIRDHNGEFIIGFSNYYGHTSNITAEFNAIRDGLSLCCDFLIEVSSVIIESDSKTLVDMLKNGHCKLWQVQNQWNQVLCKVKQTHVIQHQYREANSVADSLANESLRRKNYQIYQSRDELPILARGALVLKKAELPYMRVKGG